MNWQAHAAFDSILILNFVLIFLLAGLLRRNAHLSCRSVSTGRKIKCSSSWRNITMKLVGKYMYMYKDSTAGLSTAKEFYLNYRLEML